MEWIVIQKIGGEVKLFVIEAEHIEQALVDVASIHTEGSIEMLLTVTECKELGIELDSILLKPTKYKFNATLQKYVAAVPKGAACKAVSDDSKLCVRCGEQLDFVKGHIIHWDVCDACEAVEKAKGWPKQPSNTPLVNA